METKEKPKVLVVDDKYYIRELMITALGLRGYEVLSAGTGQEGLELARSERPALILLDLLMPGIDGYEMIRRLRSDPVTRDIPILVMSAKAELEDGPAVAGVQDYIIKPFDLEVMESKVDYYVRGAGARPSPRSTEPSTGSAPPQGS